MDIWFYQDGTTFEFGSFAANITGMVRAEVNAEYRRQISVGTHEAMAKKAKAGHVTGGRVFGYRNIEIVGADGTRSHVERQIDQAEAAVVRRIFELATAGYGRKRIALALNAENAPAPRAQRGRPKAWCPSSVTEALHRELYRGRIIWNRTRKRDRSGQHRQRPRAEASG